MVEASKPVVVGIDGSEASIEALREARDMAELFGSPLTVVMAWQWPVLTGEIPDVIGLDLEQDTGNRLDESLLAVFGDELPDWVEPVVREGQPARILTDLSADARMVVVGSRGRGGFTGLLLGSVSSAVGAHARCPVLITHRADR